MFLVSHYRRERDSVFSSRPHFMDSMDCNPPAESDRAVKGESNPKIFWTVSGKRAVHKEAGLCSLTHLCPFCCSAAGLVLGQQCGKSRQSPKPGNSIQSLALGKREAWPWSLGWAALGWKASLHNSCCFQKNTEIFV